MTTSLFAVLRIRFVSESEKVQDRGETTTRCRSQGGREIWVELVQRLSLSFEVGRTRSRRYLLAEIQINRRCFCAERGAEEIRQGMCRLVWCSWD